MTKGKKQIYVIIPCFNEGGVVGGVLDGLLEQVDKIRGCQISITVINDGSTDNTKDVVSKRHKVTLINHILNSGAGAATRTGLNFAYSQGADYAFTMDADGQHAPADLTKVIKQMLKDASDIVIGSRLVDSSGMPWYRVLGNRGLSFFTFLLFGLFVSDSQSGLRGFNRKALKNISFQSDNFTFNSELMWRIRQQRLTVKEVPIRAIYTDYSLAKGQSNWEAVHIFRQLLKRRFLEFFNG